MQRTIAAVLCANLLLTACAGRGGTRFQTPQSPPAANRPEASLMADYVKRLAIGARVIVSLVDGRRMKGTLMKADDQSVVIQERTRIPEAPVEVPIGRIAAVELETGGGAGRTIGIGIATGAGGALAVFLILAALFAGD